MQDVLSEKLAIIEGHATPLCTDSFAQLVENHNHCLKVLYTHLPNGGLCPSIYLLEALVDG